MPENDVANTPFRVVVGTLLRLQFPAPEDGHAEAMLDAIDPVRFDLEGDDEDDDGGHEWWEREYEWVARIPTSHVRLEELMSPVEGKQLIEMTEKNVYLDVFSIWKIIEQDLAQAGYSQYATTDLQEAVEGWLGSSVHCAILDWEKRNPASVSSPGTGPTKKRRKPKRH